jgi:SAM-dependent methyltransferase
MTAAAACKVWGRRPADLRGLEKRRRRVARLLARAPPGPRSPSGSWRDHRAHDQPGPDPAGARAFYRQYAPRYDQQAAWYDRVLLGDGRAWAGAQSRGAVLEVAIGTGRNLPYYPSDRRLTGIDLTPAMLTLARDRARDLGVAAALLVADAQALPFPAASFDSVV